MIFITWLLLWKAFKMYRSGVTNHCVYKNYMNVIEFRIMVDK